MPPLNKKETKQQVVGITQAEHHDILEQIEGQDTGWRYERDKDEDWLHFRQRDAESLAMLEKRGIKVHPIDNFIGKETRNAVSTLYENKRDARIIANPNLNPDLVAAIGEKLSVAEDDTRCDSQCFDAAYKQAGVGLSWLEVHRNNNPVETPYQISEAPRNELFRDETVPLREWYNGRWMYQRKYIHWKVAQAVWPDKAKEIKRLFETRGTFDWQPPEGGDSTGLFSSLDDHEFWTKEERNWLDDDKGLINIGVAYVKKTKSGLVLFVPGSGSFVFDKENPSHLRLASQPNSQIVKAPVTVMHRTWFAGPLVLGSDIVKSGKFPYVPFFFYIDGRTGYPYGISRFIMSLQAEHNARSANDLWNLGSMRIKMTNGAVDMPVEEFVKTVSRPDAVITLKLDHMAEGGIYEEKREYELSEEQYKRNVDLRQSMREGAGTDDAKEGFAGTPDNLDFMAPGKSLSMLKSNFEESRMAVLERLLDFVLEDSLGEETVAIPAKIMASERTVVLNRPLEDGTVENDVALFKGKVRLHDIPSSPERARKEMVSLSEIAKSVKHEGMQNKIAPWVVSQSGIPYKEELARELREVAETPSEEQIKERVNEAVEAALLKGQIDLKKMELGIRQQEADVKEMSATAKAEKDEADAALTEVKQASENIQQIYAAMQAAMAIWQNAGIIPIGQQVLNSGGFEDQDKSPVVSSPSQVSTPAQDKGNAYLGSESPNAGGIKDQQGVSSSVEPVGPMNTSPLSPPVVQATPQAPNIESASMPPLNERAEEGVNEGIEMQGNQVNSNETEDKGDI